MGQYRYIGGWRKHTILRFLVIASLVCLMLNSMFGTFSPHVTAHAASRPGTPNTPSGKRSPRSHPDIKGEAAWFQLSHFGNQHPAPDAERKAWQQVKILPSTPGSWTPLGPQPLDTTQCGSYCDNWGLNSGRISALAVNPVNANDLWAGAADGGVWHSSDGGSTWSPLTDYLSTLSTGALAIDPSTTQSVAQTVYVGMGEFNPGIDGKYPGDGILKTTNGGQSWTLYGSTTFAGSDIVRIAVNPSFPLNVMAAASHGIYLSTDGGQTWPTTSIVPNQSNAMTGSDVVYDPANPSIVFAGMGGIVTRDGSGILTVSPVWMSTDYGQTWSPLDLGLATDAFVQRTSLGISQDGTHLYAVPADGSGLGNLLNGKIYVYNITGKQWFSYPLPTSMSNDGGESQWAYESAVGVDPTANGAGTAYVGGVDLWQTQDGGVNWTNITDAQGINFGNVHPDQHAIAFLPGTSSFYLGNDGGIWKATNSNPLGYPDFINLNGGGLNITQFYGGGVSFTGPDAALYGGAQDNGEVQYPSNQFNGPGTWKQVYGDADAGDTVVDYTNNAVVYEEGLYGALRKSMDGGQTWNSAISGLSLIGCPFGQACSNNNVNFVMPFIMSPRTHTTLFAGTEQIYMTTDGGSNWSSISSAPPVSGFGNSAKPISALAVAPSGENYVYAGDNGGAIYATNNGGATWTGTFACVMLNGKCEPVTEPVTSLAVDLTNPLVVYATFAGFSTLAGGRVFKSTNGGATWSDISTSLPDIPFESVVVNPGYDPNVIAASDAGVFTSTDGGQAWSQLGSNLPNVAIDQLFTDHDGTQLFVATHGRGMWEMPLPGTTHVYYATCNTVTGPPTNDVFALNAASGLVTWSYPTNGCNQGPALANGSVFVTNSGGVLALNASNGSLLWQHASTVTFGRPVAANGLVYVSGSDKQVYAFNATTGAQVWTSGCLCKAKNVSTLGTPLYTNSEVYVSDESAYIYALNATTGVTTWAYSGRAGPGINLAYESSGNMLYFGAMDSKSNSYMMALNATSGRLVWSVLLTTGEGLGPDDPVVSNGVVYFLHQSYDLYALNATTGAQVWRASANDGDSGAPFVTSGVLYLGASSLQWYPPTSEVDAWNASNGTLIWSYMPALGSDAGYQGSPIVANGEVFVSDSTLGVRALDATSGALLWVSPGEAGGAGDGSVYDGYDIAVGS